MPEESQTHGLAEALTRSPLRLSSPLYEWDSETEHVALDELHQRVIHLKPGGFFATDIIDAVTPDGLYVTFDSEDLKTACFSPDGLYFAFLRGKRSMGVAETQHPQSEPIPLTFKWRSDVEVLSFFWLPALPQQASYADLVMVCTQGVEILRLHFEQRCAKSVKAFPTAVRLCWVEPTSGMVLACCGPRTLQPFDLRARVPVKLPKFDLVLGRNKVIEANDVAVMTLYDATFCIHADSTNGRVSLRNISNPSQGTPEHDIVIDVSEDEDAWSGTLRLSKVDNLLIIHCVEGTVSMIYDIKHRDRLAVPSVCAPCRVALSPGVEPHGTWAGWTFTSGPTVLDRASGKVYRFRADMDAVLQQFVGRFPHDLAATAKLLLRRTNCRDHIVYLLRRAMIAQTDSTDLAQGFSVINHAYRQTIEAVSSKMPLSQGKQATVSLHLLESMIGSQTVLSEKDMVSRVFYPHFLETTGYTSEDMGEAVGDVGQQEVAGEGTPPPELSWRIPLGLAGKTAGSKDASITGVSRPVRSPYIVSAAVSYLRSLLSMQILPHKILQCFVFDVCMHFEQEHTLQQLLHYHVLLDSTDLVLRLKEVAVSRERNWATQACLDMALRLQEHGVVADMLLHIRQYLDVVPFLINQQLGSFPVRRLLEQVEADGDARAEDPELLDHVAHEVHLWHEEALASGGRLVVPDLSDCSRWLPAEPAGEAESEPSPAGLAAPPLR